MLNDSEQTPEAPDVRHWLHLLVAFVVFVPSALNMFFWTLFPSTGPERIMLWVIAAVCLAALVVAAFSNLYGLAYVAAVAPFPILYLIVAILSGPITRKWTEDVLLDDRSIIQVKRMVKFIEGNSLSGDASNAVEADAMISFTGELEKLPPWRVPLMPLVLYRDKETKEWVVVALTTSGDVWRKRGKPCPEYWEFRLTGNGWHESPLSASSIGRPANLLHEYQTRLGVSHITIKYREERESSATIGKEFRTVIPREEAFCWTAFH